MKSVRPLFRLDVNKPDDAHGTQDHFILDQTLILYSVALAITLLSSCVHAVSLPQLQNFLLDLFVWAELV